MGIDRTLTVRPGNFSANSKVYSSGPEGLAAQIRNLQAIDASREVIAAAHDDLTTDSSGVAGQSLVVGDHTGGLEEDVFVATNGDLGIPTGHPVVFRGSDLPDGITAGTTYYVIRLQGSGQAGTKSPDTFSVAASQLQAEQGVKVEMVDSGTGTQWIQRDLIFPPAPIAFVGTGGTNGLLDTQVAAVLDTHLETLASVYNLMEPLRITLGMPTPGHGSLTGSPVTVPAIDVAATANTTDDDAAPFDEVVVAIQELEDAIVTMALNVNDVASALGVDELIVSLSPRRGVETTDGSITASTGATGVTGSAASTVELTVFNANLVTYGAAIGQILNRIDVVSATAGVDNWTHQLVPTATEVPQVTQGLRTRQS